MGAADPFEWPLCLRLTTLQAQLRGQLVLNHAGPHGKPFGFQSSVNTIWRPGGAGECKVDPLSAHLQHCILLTMMR